jgi:GTP-binding protein
VDQQEKDEEKSKSDRFKQWLFRQKSEFILGATSLKNLSHSDFPEFAFVGRSNVGKSSLVNAILERKSLARVSKTPGATAQINLYNLADLVLIADLPGYGYAKTSASTSRSWARLMVSYLGARANLRRVFLLIDGKVGFKESDFDMIEILKASAVNFQIVLTKADKGIAPEIENQFIKLAKTCGALHDELVKTSTKYKTGIDIIQGYIASYLDQKDKS